jgi:hypothetical protein
MPSPSFRRTPPPQPPLPPLGSAPWSAWARRPYHRTPRVLLHVVHALFHPGDHQELAAVDHLGALAGDPLTSEPPSSPSFLSVRFRFEGAN